jgi:hypothetical protein
MVAIEKILQKLDYHILRILSEPDFDADFLSTLIGSRELVKAEVDRKNIEQSRREMFERGEAKRARRRYEMSLKEILNKMEI